MQPLEKFPGSAPTCNMYIRHSGILFRIGGGVHLLHFECEWFIFSLFLFTSSFLICQQILKIFVLKSSNPRFTPFLKTIDQILHIKIFTYV